VSPDFDPIAEVIPLTDPLHDCGEALEKSLKVPDFIRVQLIDVNTKTILKLCPCQESDGSGKENRQPSSQLEGPRPPEPMIVFDVEGKRNGA
jgi:hypothetical protein